MNFTQIRHGSHIIEYKNKKYLIDPVFADKGTMAALPMGRVKDMNPLVPMPIDFGFIEELDGLILTHLHFDHFDDTAKAMLPKDIRIFCHEADVKKVQEDGFVNVTGIHGELALGNDVSLRTIDGGRHGKGLRRLMMGRTTGYVLLDHSKDDAEPRVYITGDTIWCDSVRQTLDTYKPEVIIAFAGEARLFGGAITMGVEDLNSMTNHARGAKVIVNHLNTWNHCYLTRDSLKEYVSGKTYKDRIHIPNDGERLTI